MSRQLAVRILLAIAGSAALHALVVGLVRFGPAPAEVAAAAGEGGFEVRLASAGDRAPAPSVPGAATAPLDVPPGPAPHLTLPAIPLPTAEPARGASVEYYPAQDLDERAQPLAGIDIVAPETEGVEYVGMVKLELRIGSDGSVEDVAVLESTVPKAFEASAVAAFRSARFAPAKKDGQFVKSRKTIEVTYAPTRK